MLGIGIHIAGDIINGRRVPDGPCSRAFTCVWFNDLRFAVVGRAMPFRYGACRDGVNGPWKVYRLTNDDNGSELFEAIPD